MERQRIERIALLSGKAVIAIDQPQTGIYQIRVIRLEYAADQQRDVFRIKQIVVIQETDVFTSGCF